MQLRGNWRKYSHILGADRKTQSVLASRCGVLGLMHPARDRSDVYCGVVWRGARPSVFYLCGGLGLAWYAAWLILFRSDEPCRLCAVPLPPALHLRALACSGVV